VDKSLKTLVWLTKTFGEGFVSLFTSEGGQDLLGMAPVDEEGKAVKEVTQDQETQGNKRTLVT